MAGIFDFGWQRTPAEWMTLVAWVFVGLKLIAAAIQAVILRHDYSERPDTVLFRIVYAVGKVTPSLFASSLCVASALDGDWATAREYGLLALGFAVLALTVVRLRQQGKFFGLAHLISKRRA